MPRSKQQGQIRSPTRHLLETANPRAHATGPPERRHARGGRRMTRRRNRSSSPRYAPTQPASAGAHHLIARATPTRCERAQQARIESRQVVGDGTQPAVAPGAIRAPTQPAIARGGSNVVHATPHLEPVRGRLRLARQPVASPVHLEPPRTRQQQQRARRIDSWSDSRPRPRHAPPHRPHVRTQPRRRLPLCCSRERRQPTIDRRAEPLTTQATSPAR